MKNKFNCPGLMADDIIYGGQLKIEVNRTNVQYDIQRGCVLGTAVCDGLNLFTIMD